MGHTPQFTAVTLYSTTGQVVCTGSQVKSSLFLSTSERRTFSEGGESVLHKTVLYIEHYIHTLGKFIYIPLVYKTVCVPIVK